MNKKSRSRSPRSYAANSAASQRVTHPRITQPGVKMPIVKAGSYSPSLFHLFGSGWLLLVLIVLLLLSSFAVVYVRDYHRRLFIEQQHLNKTHNALMTQWSKLLLEQTTWSNQRRIEHIAETKLNMVIPARKDIVMVNLKQYANNTQAEPHL